MTDKINPTNSTNEQNEFTLTHKEALFLYKFFFDVGYISYEHNPGIHDLFQKLKKYINAHRKSE